MPSVINGIGTWYYGKGNLTERKGTCKHCGKSATIRSYDTTMYFCVIFIPIVPLGKRRILDECSSCRRHGYVKLSEWERQKAEILTKAREAYQRDPTEPARAAEAVGACFTFQEYATFHALAPTILSRLGENPDTLRMMGAAYSTLGDTQKAAQLYRASLAIDDKPETRERYAVLLIKQGRADEAERFLQHIMDRGPVEKAPYLFLLVEGHQAAGEHGRAIYVLDKLAAMLPEIRNNKEYNKIRKRSEKNLRTGKRFASKTVATSAPRTGPARSTAAVVSKWIAPVLLLLALVIYFGVAYTQGRSREVYLVNGLSKPYFATVNDTRYTLRPMGITPIKVAEGDVAVSGEGEGFSIPRQTVRLKTNFFTRPFLDPTLVLNPDGVAVFRRLTVYYVVPPKEAPSGTMMLFAGEPFYDFGSLDHVFESPPETIKMPKRSKPIPKESVELLTEQNVSRTEIVLDLLSEAGEEVTIRYLARRLRLGIEDDYYFSTLHKLMDSDAFVDLLREGVEARPVRVTWHRWYQIARQDESSDDEVIAEYRSLLENDPDNPSLHYLLGRLVHDPDEADALFRKSISGSHPCAFGCFALAYALRCRGDFEQCVELDARARDLEPDNPTFVNTYWEDMMRAGRYKEAIRELETLRDHSPMDTAVNYSLVKAYLLNGDEEKAKDTHTLWIRRIEHEHGSEGIEILQDHYETSRAYINGDMAGYMAILEKHDQASYGFWDAMGKGDPASARAGLEEAEALDDFARILLYIAHKKAGEDEEAAAILDELTPEFRDQSWEVAEMLDCLEGRMPPEVPRLLKLAMDPDLKAVLLSALGLAYPEHQNAFFDLARKLNYRAGPPYHYLDAVLNAPASGV